MKKTYRVSVAIVAGISLLGVTNPASSLGFGRPISRAILGEALSVTIPVRLEAGEEIANDCVAADIYFGDEKLSQASVVTTLLPGGQSERTVRVSTTALVNEPVVTMYLAVGCKAKITRKFVAFADPPGMVSLSTAGGSSLSSPGLPVSSVSALSSEALGSVEDGSGVTTTSGASGRGAASAANKRRARERSRIDTGETSSSAKAAPSGETSLSAARASPAAPATRQPSRRSADKLSAKLDARPAPPPVATSRLELDPADLDALVTPELMMSSALTGTMGDVDTPEIRERRAAAAALWAAMNASPEQLAQDRLRVQELEQRLARLQQDSAGATQKVAAMQARVEAAENKRLNHPLVWALAGLCLLLLGAVAWLFTRQRRQQEAQASWWQGEPPQDAPDTAPALGEPMMARTSAEFMPVRSTDAATPPAVEPAAAVKPATPEAAPGAAASAAASSMTTTRPVSLRSEAQDAAREITVEELIDLEQQAEFFVVLGQEDAAVELLESHVQTTAGASPLPYLKLLEIYQRLGKRDDYERIRSTFNSRFNAYAPAWESDLQQGHSLEDYPGVIDRLQSLWTMPAKTMELLQVSLTRADGSEETFDLPAYRELLFLYAVARDLEERESKDRAPVDLLLPVQEAEQDVDGRRDTSLQPLMATRPIKALPQASPSLSLDLSLDDPVPSGPGGFVDDALSGADDIPTTPSSDNSIDFEPMDLTPPKR